MSLLDTYSFEDLVNEAERLVIGELEQQLLARGDEPDEDQVLDMAAYALNQVSPRYRVNLLGRIYARNVPQEYQDEIRSAVAVAIAKVMRG